MKIERPDWCKLHEHGKMAHWYDDIDLWFDKCIEPINKMLSEGVEVYNSIEHSKWWDEKNSQAWYTHKALLINIQSIKKETAEDVLKVFINEYEGPHEGQSFGHPKDTALSEVYKRAKAVLSE